MLVHLHVKNLALIEEIEVDFGPGLNILTGETGAGKSILLGSMQLILGGKISRDMIRANAPYALVELLFQVENERAASALKALDIETEDGQVLLSRKILDGRSINKINGETSTVGQMKAAAACLLDIHGQHEHQSLLYPDKQLEILDAYGGAEAAKEKQQVAEAYEVYRASRKELDALDMDEEQRNREIAFLSFEIREIEEAALQSGEDERLEKLYRKLSNSKKIVEGLQEVRSLAGYEGGAGDQIGSAVHEWNRVASYDEDLAPLTELLTALDGMLNDFNRSLSTYLDDLTFDDETFYETEKRLDLVNNLKAKYGQSIEEILAYQETQQKKLDQLTGFEANLARLRAKTEKAREALDAACQKLSEIRQRYAKALEEEIREGLKDLNFLDVRFAIRFDRKSKYSRGGFDVIEYEIATNPGESLKPLGKIVSGGELSRIMLAIKAILADRDEIETLIFDEIDTGISGRTAQKVSEKMADIGLNRQVLCITHLPQIAAMADTHFEIEKHGDAESGTITEIHPLTSDSSVRELARLLGGAEITPAVLENAKEMKKLAESRKQRD